MASTYTDANKAYRYLTGICGTENDFFDNLAATSYGKTTEQKEQMYKDTMFKIPDGQYLTGYIQSGDPQSVADLKAVCIEAANSALGLNINFDTPAIDIDRDGDIDAIDTELKSKAKAVKAKKEATVTQEPEA